MTRTTLDLARRKAFEIHLAIATMQKPSDVWKQVDALLQILSPLDPLFDTDTDTGKTVPRGVVMAARPFGEERLFAVAAAYQAITDFHQTYAADPA